MAKVRRVLNIIHGLITGSVVVIVKEGATNAKVYCGKRCDKNFVIRSMSVTLKSLVTN